MIYFILGISVTFNLIFILSLFVIYKIRKMKILNTNDMLKDYIVNKEEMQEFFGEEI